MAMLIANSGRLSRRRWLFKRRTIYLCVAFYCIHITFSRGNRTPQLQIVRTHARVHPFADITFQFIWIERNLFNRRKYFAPHRNVHSNSDLRWCDKYENIFYLYYMHVIYVRYAKSRGYRGGYRRISKRRQFWSICAKRRNKSSLTARVRNEGIAEISSPSSSGNTAVGRASGRAEWLQNGGGLAPGKPLVSRVKLARRVCKSLVARPFSG